MDETCNGVKCRPVVEGREPGYGVVFCRSSPLSRFCVWELHLGCRCGVAEQWICGWWMAKTFVRNFCGAEAVPKRILELMGVHGLTRENVASHLQV